MRQRHSCISHGSNVEHNALRSWHATMYKFVTSMVLCGLGMHLRNAQCNNSEDNLFLIRCILTYDYIKQKSRYSANCNYNNQRLVLTVG